jgi:hypothetical protein
MSRRHELAAGLANAMLAGEWSRKEMTARCAEAVGAKGRWLGRIIGSVLRTWPEPPLNAHDALRAHVLRSRELWKAGAVRKWFVYTPRMAAPRWPVRPLDTLSDVEAWLGLSTSDLLWLSDRKGLERRAREVPLQNYRYRWVSKRAGGMRLIEAPKALLRHAQRRVLEDVLDAIPPHDASHGFRKGRSVLSHARLHAGCETVIRFDLSAFFTHVPTPRVLGVFEFAGYPEQVARTLAGLCTNRAPMSVVAEAPFEVRQLYVDLHLPQGAPTSPALANLAAWSLDVRLTELAHRIGARYSRYADDLTFSGDRSLGSRVAGLERLVGHIALEEGFSLNRLKTRVMRSSRRQIVTGAVINAGVNIPRDQYDRLKAMLHNATRDGLDAERFNTLQGKVAWVEQLNPRRGAKLRAMLARAARPPP